ncbi:MAG TPA: hypothetical protein VFY03_10785, partial [Woeseiaceae bacterium]|nr:hypothetical protein [Woeseiaceae bacterium]
MNRAYTTGIAAAALGVAHLAHAEDAQSILETAQAKQVERWTGVDRYIVTQRVMGQSTDTTYQRTEVQMSDGSTQTLFLPVAGGQAGAQDCGPMQMTPEALEAYAAGSEMVGAGMASEIEDGLEAAGLPRGLLAASGSEPNATFDPRVMMGGNAAFVRAAADAQRQQATDAARAPEQAAESADHMAEFMRRANLVGTETVDGRDSFHLRAEGLGMVQESDGREYTIESMSMWLDASEYVPLRTRVDGTMVAGDETSPMTIETVQSDYREVP